MSPSRVPSRRHAADDGDVAHRPRHGGARRWSADFRASRFDSAAFLAQFPGATPDERARWAERLLLPLAPQSSASSRGGLARPRARLCARRRLSAEMTMDRRAFLQSSLCAAALHALGVGAASVAFAAAPAGANYRNLLVLIELKGGNDGLNTVVPYDDPDLLRAAPEARDRARQRAAALGPRGPASGAGAAPAALAGPAARGAAGRRLSRAEPVAFPLDRDLGHRLVERGLSRRRMAHARVRRHAGAARVRRRRRHHRQQRSRPARRRRHARHRAVEHRSVPAAGAARRPGRRGAQQGLSARPAGRGRHRAGGGPSRRATCVRHGVSGRGIRQRRPDRMPDRRASFQRRRRAHQPVGIRHARRPDRDAGAASRRARAGHRRAQVRAHRARAMERDADRSPTRSSVAGRARTFRAARTTEPPTFISRWADAWPAASTARRRRSIGSRATATSAMRSTFAAIYATVLERWWGTPSQPVLAERFAPVPFLRA